MNVLRAFPTTAVPWIAALAVPLSGCGNTLYFMEGTKGALAVEVSASSPEPVALTAGYKRTIASIVPPRKTGERSGSDGEALSLLSRFQLAYDPDNNAVVENVFVTGKAATSIGASVQATEALLSSAMFSSDPSQETISCWLESDRDGTRAERFRSWVAASGAGGSATSVRFGTGFRNFREAAIEALSIECPGGAA